jgi:two-component SAPR family response regulator
MEAKVLIVEDEPIVALEIEDILREAGFEIVGCVGSLSKALMTLKNTDCDIAVLDANLRGESVAPVATALRQLGRPFVFVSGYERIYVPEAFLDAPSLPKPVEPSKLISVVRQLLS